MQTAMSPMSPCACRTYSLHLGYEACFSELNSLFLSRFYFSPFFLLQNRGQVPDLEVQDLFTRLQPHLPSLLLEPEVEFFRGSKEDGIASEWRPMAQLSALRLVRELTKTMTSKQVALL